jgi:hypothetical protein
MVQEIQGKASASKAGILGSVSAESGRLHSGAEALPNGFSTMTKSVLQPQQTTSKNKPKMAQTGAKCPFLGGSV